MSTVRPPPLLGRLVDLDVLDDQVAGVQTLGIRVGLGVLEQAEQELGGLDGPAGFADTELLAYSSPKPISMCILNYASSHMAMLCLSQSKTTCYVP